MSNQEYWNNIFETIESMSEKEFDELIEKLELMGEVPFAIADMDESVVDNIIIADIKGLVPNKKIKYNCEKISSCKNKNFSTSCETVKAA